MNNDYEFISSILSSTAFESAESCHRKPASVAMILQKSETGLELFFIERASHPDDPWSGNIGFPGGRMESYDRSLRHAAERETMEEVGIDLSSASYLGRLSDIVGHNLPVRVSCFVYGLVVPANLLFSDEVQDAFWIRLDYLLRPEQQLSASVAFDGRSFEVPAIDLGLPGKPVLWGITYRLVTQLKKVLESDGKLPLPYELSL